MQSRYLKPWRDNLREVLKKRKTRPLNTDEILALGIACLKVEPAPGAGIAQAVASNPFTEGSSPTGRRFRLKFHSIAFAPISIAVGAGMSVGLAYWNRIPDIDIPQKPLPNPNAYYTYAKATALIQHAPLFHLALRKTLSPGIRVPVLLQEPLPSPAHGAKEKHTLSTVMVGSKDYVPQWQLSRAALIKENSAALKVFRTGLDTPFRIPRPDYDNLIEGTFPLAQLLRMDTDVKAETGDWSGSMQSALDLIRMGDQIDTVSPLSQQSTMLGITKPGYDAAARAMNHLTSRDLRSAATIIERGCAARAPYSDCAEEQARALLNDLKRTFSWSGWRSAVNNQYYPNRSISAPQVGLFTSKTALARDYVAYAHSCIAVLQQPYSPTRALPATDNPLSVNLEVQITNAETPYIASGPLQDSLLATGMALRAYWLDHGRYPERLQDLAPHYVTTVPEDPFFAGRPLQYLRAVSTCWIYTLGPDRSHRTIDPRRGIVYGYPDQYQGTAKGNIVAIGTPKWVTTLDQPGN